MEEKTDKLLRRNLCERIFRSNYFEENGEDWIDVYDKKVIQSLKFENDVLFKVWFKLSKNPVARFTRYGGSKYLFRNGYRRFAVSVGNLHQIDYAFECLVRDRRTGQIKEYFVSRAYNVNMSQLLLPIGARFIFSFDRENDKLMVHALAEKPVYIRKLSDVESFYLQNREMYPFMTSKYS